MQTVDKTLCENAFETAKMLSPYTLSACLIALRGAVAVYQALRSSGIHVKWLGKLSELHGSIN